VNIAEEAMVATGPDNQIPHLALPYDSVTESPECELPDRKIPVVHNRQQLAGDRAKA
jgi:hypothetical protein